MIFAKKNIFFSGICKKAPKKYSWKKYTLFRNPTIFNNEFDNEISLCVNFKDDHNQIPFDFGDSIDIPLINITDYLENELNNIKMSKNQQSKVIDILNEYTSLLKKHMVKHGF